MFDLSCKLIRFLQHMAQACPKVFYENSLNLTRLSELIIGAIGTADSESAQGELFSNFIKKITKRGIHPSYYEYGIYGTISGILINLDKAEKENNWDISIYDTIVKVDCASDSKIFEKLRNFSWSESKHTTSSGLEIHLPMLYLVLDKLKLKYESKSNDSNDEEDDDNLCSICYAYPIDTYFIPCNHKSCNQCISRHLLDKKTCFFCNTPVEKIENIK